MAIIGVSIARGLAMIVSLGFDYCLEAEERGKH